MKVLARVLVSALFAQFFMFAPAAHAVNYTIAYNANQTQHQAGVTSGSVPSTTTHASGAVVTVAAN